MKITASILLNIVLVAILCTLLFLSDGRVNTDGRDGIAGAGKYDPWIDINDDGVIDVTDFQLLKISIPSAGDPTKSVIIAEFNWSQFSYDFWLEPGEEGNVSITTAGYKQITLGFKASPEVGPSFGNVSVATGFLTGNFHVYVDRFNATLGWTGPERPILYEYPVVRTYDIRGSSLTIAFYNPNEIAYELLIGGYMTT